LLSDKLPNLFSVIADKILDVYPFYSFWAVSRESGPVLEALIPLVGPPFIPKVLVFGR